MQSVAGSINRTPYVRAFEAALDDLTAILGVTDEAYQTYRNVRLDVRERNHPDLRRKEKLIEDICARITFSQQVGGKETHINGFYVRFWPISPDRTGVAPGFVSWLQVNFAARTLTIVYDPKRVRDNKPVGHGDKVVSHSGFEEDQLLAKIFLHECGHARLHLQDMWDGIMTQGQLFPALDKKLEQEAWAYAMAVWGILVGDHAFCARKNQRPDEGWLHA